MEKQLQKDTKKNLLTKKSKPLVWVIMCADRKAYCYMWFLSKNSRIYTPDLNSAYLFKTKESTKPYLVDGEVVVGLVPKKEKV